jgi:hypothetical protein
MQTLSLSESIESEFKGAAWNNMIPRYIVDRRNSRLTGTPGPWFTTGIMGGLIFTDRRKIVRRMVDKRNKLN